MKKDGKYRYTLQFSSDSEEQIRVGELLENLGNRKSAVIVSALSEYLNVHPEIQPDHGKIEVKVTSTFNPERLEQLVRDIVERKLSNFHITEKGDLPNAPISGASGALEEDIAQMLSNLDVFN